MSVVKQERYLGDFTTIPNSTINDRDLSYDALGVWLYIMSKPKDWSIRLSDLRNRLTRRVDKKTGKRQKAGRDYIQGILNELKEAGLARLIPNKDPETGEIKGRVWVISDIDYRRTENPAFGDGRQTDSPTNGKPRRREKPTVGKPGHIVKTDSLLNTNKELINTEVVEESTATTEDLIPDLKSEEKEEEKVAAAVDVATSEPTEKEKVEAIVAALNSPGSIHTEGALKICQDKKLDFATQSHDYAMSVFQQFKFPLSEYDKSELRKRFWQSMNGRRVQEFKSQITYGKPKTEVSEFGVEFIPKYNYGT